MQRQASALTAALQDNNNTLALPRSPSTGLKGQDQKSLSTAETRPAAMKTSTAIHESKVAGASSLEQHTPLAFSQRAPSLSNWTDDNL